MLLTPNLVSLYPPKDENYHIQTNRYGFATKLNTPLRSVATFDVCGQENYSAFHALVTCPQVIAIQESMREV